MVFGIGRKQLTPKQRRAKLKRLREEARLMEEELKEQRRIKQEREEIKRLQEQLHPSKKRKLVKLLGKAEHGGEKAVGAFLRGEKKFYNEYSKFHWKKKGKGEGLEGLYLTREKKGKLEKLGKM